MSKYIAVDLTGNITGMYLTDPGGGIELSDEDWTSVGPGYTYIGGKLIAPTAPTADELLSTAKSQQIASLSSACQSYLLAGFTSSALGSAHNYPSSLTDQQNQSSIAAAGAGGNLWCESGATWSLAAHTAAQAAQVVVDWRAYLNAAQARLVQLIASVNAATTPTAVAAVAW